jgi:hypothetical protein
LEAAVEDHAKALREKATENETLAQALLVKDAEIKAQAQALLEKDAEIKAQAQALLEKENTSALLQQAFSVWKVSRRRLNFALQKANFLLAGLTGVSTSMYCCLIILLQYLCCFLQAILGEAQQSLTDLTDAFASPDVKGSKWLARLEAKNGGGRGGHLSATSIHNSFDHHLSACRS